MAGFDAYLKAFAAVACVAFALVVLAGGRRRGGPLFLATFLLLIAGNQAAETMRALAASEAGAIFWFRVASVFAALDPLALYLFATTVERDPQRPWVARTIAAVAIALAGSALALGVHPTGDRVLVVLLLGFTATVYALVLARFLRGVGREPHEARHRTLALAAGIATVLPWIQLFGPTADLLAKDVLRVTPQHPLWEIGGWGTSLSWPVVALAACAVVVRLRFAAGQHPARAAALSLGVGYATAAALSSSTLLTIFRLGREFVPEPAWWEGVVILGRASAAGRWILFGALVSGAILRGDLLGLSLARRRAAARALVALAMIGALGLAYAALVILFGEEGVLLRPLDWLLFGIVVVAAQGFRPLIDRVAARVYGVPMPADQAAAQEAYRRAVEQAVVEGRDTRVDPGLARLRQELALGDAEAAVIERVAEELTAGPLVPGQRVGGRYVVRRLIGRGGTGRVFLARDERLDRDVVLKEVFHDEPDDERALREARAAGGLQHVNVVTVHDVLRRTGASLLVTEYLPTGSLADRVGASGPLPHEEGLRILDGVLAGLEAVHERGLVHRDLKPDNVLLTSEGEPKIADFGIARARRGVTARFDEPDIFVGTPGFMAPEQRAGARATAASDVYAVGNLARLCIQQPLPASVEEVVARALAEDPRLRWADAGAMRAALQAALLEA